ncbi:MAG: M56 family metallopeptidase [Pirellulales bacterium]
MESNLPSVWRMAEWLTTQAWQIAVVVVIVALASAVCARQRPHLALTLWLVVLLKCLTPPLWTSPTGVFCWLRGPEGRADHVARDDDDPIVPLAGIRTGESLSFSRVLPDPGTSRMVEAEPVARPREPRRTIAASLYEAWRWLADPRCWCGIWLLGVAVTIRRVGRQWWRFRQRLRQTRRLPLPGIVDEVERLRRQLGVRTPVEVWVTESPFGPAVLGIVRPVIVLPEFLVRQLNLEQLEPILAHELIHLRRRDLWLCAAQQLAASLWWFHPLVGWANRSLSREIERCCDEEVVASLGYEPARYARALLEVLERKGQLVATAAYPGVRPLDVTAARLERIMRLGHGSRRRTPWWCWLVMALLVALLVPGGAFVAEGRERRAARKAGRLPVSAPPFAPARPTADDVRSERNQSGSTSVRTYPLNDLWDRLPREWQQQPDCLAEWLRGWTRSDSAARTIDQSAGFTNLPEPTMPSVQARAIAPAAHVEKDDALVLAQQVVTARLDEVGHERLSAALERLRREGLRQYEVHCYVLSVPGAHSADAAPRRTQPPLRDLLTQPPRIMSREQLATLVVQARENADCELLAAPRVVVWSGRWATICNLDSRAFVTGYSQRSDGAADEAWQPEVRMVPEGLVLNVRPDRSADGQVQLEVTAEQQAIEGVDSRTVTLTPAGPVKPIQVPQVRTWRLATRVQIAADQVVVVAGQAPAKESDVARSLVFLFECREVAWQGAANRASNTRVYHVADLVVPLPRKAEFSVTPETSVPEVPPRTPPAVDFQPLITLITSTIAPDSWRVAGGTGKIQGDATHMSLLVSATDEVHQEIAALLTDLRRLQDVLISLEIESLNVLPEFAARVLREHLARPGVTDRPTGLPMYLLTADQVRWLAEQRGEAVERQRLPKVTLFNSGSFDLQLPSVRPSSPKADRGTPVHPQWLTLVPTALSTGREVQLAVARGKEDAAELLRTVQKHTLGPGQALLIDATLASEFPAYAAGIPLLREAVELEGPLRTRVAAPAARRHWLVVTPRLLTQEEESPERWWRPQALGRGER